MNVHTLAIGFLGDIHGRDLTACGADETRRQIAELRGYSLALTHEGQPVTWEHLDNPEEPRTILQFIVADRSRRIDSKTLMADRPPFALATIQAGRIVRLEFYEGHDALECSYDFRAPELADKALPRYLDADPQAYDPAAFLRGLGMPETVIDLVKAAHNGKDTAQ